MCADTYSGGGVSPFFVTGSQYFPPTDDVMLGHVTRPTPPAWGPAYAVAAAAAAAATYYRYALATVPSPSPFTPQFRPGAGYFGVNDPLTPAGSYCGLLGVDVDRCLKTLRCGLSQLPQSTSPTSWQRSRGKYHPCLFLPTAWNH